MVSQYLGGTSVKRHIAIKGYLFLSLLMLDIQLHSAPKSETPSASMGLVGFNVVDVKASKQFWQEFGAIPLVAGKMTMVKIPGALFTLTAAAPTSGSEGSTVDHIGFLVQHGESTMKFFKDHGLKTSPTPEGCANHPNHNCGFVFTREGVKIEIIEKPDIKTPFEFDQIHFFCSDSDSKGDGAVMRLRTWYVETFGAIPKRLGKDPFFLDTAELPGVSLRFTKSDGVTAPTMGRSLDHIGLEVRDLKEFYKAANANGIKFDRPYRQDATTGLGTTLLTDPQGTQIELIEGLAPYLHNNP